jgi:hypothetical protein
MPEGLMRNRRSSGALQWSVPAILRSGVLSRSATELAQLGQVGLGLLGTPFHGLIEAAQADGVRLAMLLDGPNGRAAREPAQQHERDWPPELPIGNLEISNLETSGGVRAGCSAVVGIEWFRGCRRLPRSAVHRRACSGGRMTDPCVTVSVAGIAMATGSNMRWGYRNGRDNHRP